MAEGFDESMGELPSPRRGRPRKAVPDGAGVQAIQDVHPDTGGQREDADKPRSGVGFERLAKLAETLSDAGQVVTQIHCTGEDKPWSYWATGCATFSHASEDVVVTTDGKRHTVNG